MGTLVPATRLGPPVRNVTERRSAPPTVPSSEQRLTAVIVLEVDPRAADLQDGRAVVGQIAVEVLDELGL